MDVKTAFILSTSLSIVLLQILMITTKADEALIKKLCDATPAPEVCQSCLESDPSSKSADETGLAEKSLICVANDLNLLSQNTLSYQQNTTDRNMKFALGVCLDWRFEFANDYVKIVSPMIMDRNLEMARGMTEVQIMGRVTSCASFVQSKGLQVPAVVSKGIADVARDCQILMGILDSINTSLSIIFSLQFSIITTKADEALINRLCNATPSPDACKTCLHTYPSSDEVGIALSTMSCGATDIAELYRTTIGAQQSVTEPAMKGALGVCLDRITDAQNKIRGVADTVKSKDFKAAQGMIKSQILAPIFSCTDAIKSKGLQVPDAVNSGISTVARDWNVVLSILGSIQ
ncbi:hypothetical protein Cgig2_004115 [Carnegiea gigantea]|uniref:Pectinesterase inhibitor domain-containing protein n=1 Tax=Carnegiea gigantea TaxID=171969 RepID=A0A9Q1KSJ0_9CARY|nr:hypothetical protein Cgig2_004115 [Carnegiea gigantea]